MKLIVTRYRDRVELLACYQDSMLHGGLFVPTRRPEESGQRVVLDIRVPGLQDAVMIRGVVVWKRNGRRSTGHRAGMGVEFLVTEGEKRDYLLAMARGSTDKSMRRHARLPLYIPGGFHMLDDMARRACTISDIGPGGAFVQTRETIPVGTGLILVVAVPGTRAQHSIQGRVAWSRDTPGREGIGIEFQCRDLAGKRRIRELIRRLREFLMNPPESPGSVRVSGQY